MSMVSVSLLNHWLFGHSDHFSSSCHSISVSDTIAVVVSVLASFSHYDRSPADAFLASRQSLSLSLFWASIRPVPVVSMFVIVRCRHVLPPSFRCNSVTLTALRSHFGRLFLVSVSPFWVLLTTLPLLSGPTDFSFVDVRSFFFFRRHSQ